MKFKKYVEKGEGLGMLPERDRMVLREATIEGRYLALKKMGMSRREALRRSQRGSDPKGMPTYLHRSSDLTCLEDMGHLDYASTWEPSHGYSDKDAQTVIDQHIERVSR